MAKLSKHVLIVDDEAGAVETLGYIFEAEGFAATCATSAVDALTALEGQRFDLVLLDIIMPDVDGLRLGSLIRERFSGTPLVFMTRYYDEHAFAAFRGQPDVALLHKPLAIPALLEVCRRLLTAPTA